LFQQQFWKRWSADYLNELQQRQSWQKPTPGEVVLLKDDNTKPLQWPTAVITDMHLGSDGNIRVVTIKTSRGIFKRPIAKLALYPM
jgi:hypothetical protein